MNATLSRRTLLWAALYTGLITGCGVFPDKEKDYVYSREIEKLAIPPELTRHPPQSAARPEEDQSTVPSAPSAASRENTALTARLIHSSNQPPYLHINDNFDKAWLAITKALSRNHIEISDRNRAEGLLDIRYPPRGKSSAGGENWWDELLFIFSSAEHQEKRYFLLIQEQQDTTQLIILDDKKTPLNDNIAHEILALLGNAINSATTTLENEKAPDSQ